MLYFTTIAVCVAKKVIFSRLKCDNTLNNRCNLNMNQIIKALNLCSDNRPYLRYLCFRKKIY